MRPKALSNLFAMLRSGTDKQHRTPVSAQNRQIEANRGVPAGRLYVEYWHPDDKRRFFSQKELGEMRRHEDIRNSIGKRTS